MDKQLAVDVNDLKQIKVCTKQVIELTYKNGVKKEYEVSDAVGLFLKIKQSIDNAKTK